ncbi:MAG: PspA-associated protein PspAA [Nocardioidaceae bacterium]
MIVRILGEGQWRIEDGELDALNTLDDKVESAVEAGDENAFRPALDELLAAVRRAGSQLDLDELVDSDLVLPPGDASLDEVKDLLSDDGLIPG